MLVKGEVTKTDMVRHICAHHQKHPEDTNYPACTCSSGYVGGSTRPRAPTGPVDPLLARLQRLVELADEDECDCSDTMRCINCEAGNFLNNFSVALDEIEKVIGVSG